MFRKRLNELERKVNNLEREGRGNNIKLRFLLNPPICLRWEGWTPATGETTEILVYDLWGNTEPIVKLDCGKNAIPEIIEVLYVKYDVLDGGVLRLHENSDVL